MTTFHIHSEGDFSAEAAFLAEVLPALHDALRGHLGPSPHPLDDVHVILSPSGTHAKRFPPEPNELRSLEPYSDGDDPAEDGRDQMYAHGVATRASSALDLPSAVPDGVPTIHLDIPKLQTLADEFNVTLEGMLARVGAHELAHHLRGHITYSLTAPTSRTHGYLQEGDAQRDAWEVGLQFAGDPEWLLIGANMLAAQARLSNRQPSAYQHFAHGDPSINSWAAGDTPHVNNFSLRDEGDLSQLAEASTSVIDIEQVTLLGIPRAGDHVYLHDGWTAVGPFVVLTIRPADRTLGVRRAVGVEARRLHIRPVRTLGAGPLPANGFPTPVSKTLSKIEMPKPQLDAAFADRDIQTAVMAGTARFQRELEALRATARRNQ